MPHGRVLGLVDDAAEQGLVACQSEHVADPLALQPIHRLGTRMMAVAAHQGLNPWRRKRPTSVPSGVLPGRRMTGDRQIGRAEGRDRVRQYVESAGGAVEVKK